MDKEAQELDSLYNNWSKDPSKASFQSLYKKLKPEIQSAGMKASFGSNLPQSAHNLFAAQAFLDALNTYNPKSGATLKTHVYGSVQNKSKRLNYMYQDLGYKPEPRAMQVGRYQTEFENMRVNLGREPSVGELADRLNWNVKEVMTIQKELTKDLSLSDGVEEHAVIEGSKDEEILNYLYYELNGEEQVIYDYVFGKHGKQKLTKGDKRPDYAKIASRVGFSESKVRAIWNKVAVKYKKYLEK